MLKDERRVKILGKRLPGSLEHSEGDCAVCATRQACVCSLEHSEGDCAVCATRQAACEGSGQTFTRLA